MPLIRFVIFFLILGAAIYIMLSFARRRATRISILKGRFGPEEKRVMLIGGVVVVLGIFMELLE